MRIQIGAALLAAMALAGCAGPQGNPNGTPYATDAGGTVATAPMALGTASYDPYAKAPTFADMDIGSSAITPTATPPSNVMPMGPQPAPRRPGPMPR
jgi:hypothetical protein